MNDLLQKYNDYMRIVGGRVEYTLADGSSLSATYREDNFPHLIGLHKLRDIQLIQFWLDRTNKTIKLMDVIRKIKNENFTDTDVRASHFFQNMADRYLFFSYDNLTTLNYTDAIIDFKPTLMGSLLKSDYILFEERPSGEYNHMAIANTPSNGRYIESFFHEKTNNYLNGQTIVKIKAFTLYDKNGKIIVSDNF